MAEKSFDGAPTSLACRGCRRIFAAQPCTYRLRSFGTIGPNRGESAARDGSQVHLVHRPVRRGAPAALAHVVTQWGGSCNVPFVRARLLKSSSIPGRGDIVETEPFGCSRRGIA